MVVSDPLFQIDHESDIPIWVQLRNRLVYLISSGHYQPGDQLPTVRELAAEASMNYNTVNKAYLNLTNDGYITTSRGKGAFVNNLSIEDIEENDEEVVRVLDDCISVCRDLGLTLPEIEKSLSRKIRQKEDLSNSL